MAKFGAIGCIALVVVAAILGLTVMSTYNSLNVLDQEVRKQWAQVENVYQRRADLIPNLVETVKGAAGFEKETYTQVAEARAKVGQISGDALKSALDDPQAEHVAVEGEAGFGVGHCDRRVVDAEKEPSRRPLPARIALARRKREHLEHVAVWVLEIERLDAAGRDVPVGQALRAR